MASALDVLYFLSSSHLPATLTRTHVHTYIHIYTPIKHSYIGVHKFLFVTTRWRVVINRDESPMWVACVGVCINLCSSALSIRAGKRRAKKCSVRFYFSLFAFNNKAHISFLTACKLCVCVCVCVCVCTRAHPPYHQHRSHWFTPTFMLLGSLAPLGTEKPSDVSSSTPASRNEYLWESISKPKLLIIIMCRLSKPGLHSHLPSSFWKIFCLASLESGSNLLLLIINIYEQANRPRKLFIIIVCRPLYSCTVIKWPVSPPYIHNLGFFPFTILDSSS